MKNGAKKASTLAMAMMLGIGGTLGAGMNYVNVSKVYAASSTTASETTTSKQLIDLNTTWKYLDNNEDPGTSDDLQCWTKANYDDSSWKSAAGLFGAKKGQLAAIGTVTPTVLLTQYQEDGSTNIPAYFFRTTFNVDQIEENAVVKGTVQYDDGAIVYLNGKQIASFGDVTVDTSTNLYYGGNNEGAGDPGEGTFTIEANELKTGENVIAVEIHQSKASSSDVFFAMPSLTMEVEDTSSLTQNDVILTVGSDALSRNLTWYADNSKAGKVQVAKADGTDTFPADYKEFDATSSISNDSGFYTNQATITGLEADTQYVYRLVNGDTVSQTYSFKTGSSNDFTFALVGDPQIGAGSTTSDTEGWAATLEVITNTLDPDFMLSAGDQVNTASNETQYTGYLNESLSSLTSATTVGNHDSGSAAYGEHFNLPNESTELGTTTAGGDYWFVYNNTLFMGINSNDQSTSEHKEFMEEAIAANPDVTWKTVFFHHSIYSTASHWNNTDIINRRAELPAVFDELDIDVVLMGHDHVYTRSKIMDVGTPSDEGTDSEVYNPEGILYLTANSASGSKYYELQDGAIAAGYAAKYDQSKRRTVTDITVTDSSYTMTTYYADDMSVLDTYTIYKTDKTNLEAQIEAADTIIKAEDEANYTSDSFAAFKEALEAASTVYADESAKQDEIDNAVQVLADAMAALGKVDKTALATAIENAQTVMENEADYTADSFAALKEAYASANAVYADTNANQEAIDNATESLNNAVAALEEIETENNDQTDSDDNDDTDNESSDNTQVDNNTSDSADQDSTTVQDSTNTTVQDSTTVEDTTSTEEQTSTPQTGDTTNAVAMGLMMVAAAGVAVMTIQKKKETEVK